MRGGLFTLRTLRWNFQTGSPVRESTA